MDVRTCGLSFWLGFEGMRSWYNLLYNKHAHVKGWRLGHVQAFILHGVEPKFYSQDHEVHIRE